MTHEFEIRDEITVDATPEQVWDAIATGPGVDAWFMGHSEFGTEVGARASMTMGGQTGHSTITAYEPGKRFAYRGDDNPDGTFMAFEYLIEGRDGGSTTVRFVHSGLLGDDWEAEYDALKHGDPMYLHQLAAYLKHFAGRTLKRSVFAVGPQEPDQQKVWSVFGDVLGLDGPIVEGAAVRLGVDGLERTDGVVEYVSTPHYVGVRNTDGLHLLMHGYQNTVVVEVHGYTDGQAEDEQQAAWQGWLGTAFR
ncbi:MAG TPA: SRPBCC domain-containing protein [Pseudonocardiaceae bacterium]|nr:SRPBCC domain-containing protein [Pseudonocardiaceae bacterium]